MRERGGDGGREGGREGGRNEQRGIMSNILNQVLTHIVCVNLFLDYLQVSVSCPTHCCRMLAPLQPMKFLLSDLQHMADFSKYCLEM